MIKAKIVGACGYGGVGMLELLEGHPEVEVAAIVDVENVGVPISKMYPHLEGYCDQIILDASDPKAVEPVDVVFYATPDRVGMKLAPAEVANGTKVIDFSGDFRFNCTEAYAEYASRIKQNTEHVSPELLDRAVYGLAELHRAEIATQAVVVGNPGCFAVSCILGLAPAVKLRMVHTSSIICDCKTGVSGAGKKPTPAHHYPARYQEMNAYKLAGHQHVCEIERELGLLARADIKLTFTAQVVPVCRGIMSTLYCDLLDNVSETEVVEAYKSIYRDEPFIRVYESTAPQGTQQVRGTNRCNLVVSVDERTNRLRVISYIDNLMKGQAGSALQCMNVLFGLPETTGLKRPAMYP